MEWFLGRFYSIKNFFGFREVKGAGGYVGTIEGTDG